MDSDVTAFLMLLIVFSLAVSKSNGCHQFLTFGHDQATSPSTPFSPRYYTTWRILQSHGLSGELINCAAKQVVTASRQKFGRDARYLKANDRFKNISEEDEITYIVQNYPDLCKALLICARNLDVRHPKLNRLQTLMEAVTTTTTIPTTTSTIPTAKSTNQYLRWLNRILYLKFFLGRYFG